MNLSLSPPPCTKRSQRLWLAITTALICVCAAGSAMASDVYFSVIIGHNHSDDAELAALRYADDDALRYHQLLGRISQRTELLTNLDPETERLVGQRQTKTPTRAAVLETVASIHKEMDAVAARGDRPIFYFVYSGHGNYDAEGRGYVHLADGRLTQRDLFHKVLTPTRDHPVILLVDACNASLLVNSRGASAERRPTTPSKYKLENFPNVGVILASSTVNETHEWGRYLAGIFSHEVRSAMVGAADLDDDQRVTFAELAAFVAAANARVTNPNVAIQPYIRPPLATPNLAVMDIAAGRFPSRIRIDKRIAGKAHVVDSDLIRYADFHLDQDSPGFWLALTRPQEYVIVQDDVEYIVPAAARGDIGLEDLRKRKRTVLSARGAGSAYFDRTLFHQPYGRVFAHRYLQTDYPGDLRIQHAILHPWYDNKPAWVILGTGLAAGAVGLGLHLEALDMEKEASDPNLWADERKHLNGRIDTFNTTAGILYGVGGAAVIGSMLLFVLDRETEIEIYDPPLSVELTGQGVRLKTDW